MHWRTNLQQTQCLILQLGLQSEFFQSFLVRTEHRLSNSKYSRGLRLIPNPASEYRSVLDWLLASIAPEWDQLIINYYKNGTDRFGKVVDFNTITEIDQLMDATVRDLYKSYQTLKRHGWLGTSSDPNPGTFMQHTALAAVHFHITPLFPKPPRTNHELPHRLHLGSRTQLGQKPDSPTPIHALSSRLVRRHH